MAAVSVKISDSSRSLQVRRPDLACLFRSQYPLITSSFVQRGYFVIMACRSYSKAAIAANKMGMDPSTYKIMQLDLASLESVRNFVASVRELGKKPDALVCNAAVWYPQDKEPRLTVEGYEEVGVSSFLFARSTFPASWPNQGFRWLCKLLHGPNQHSIKCHP